MKTQFDCYKDSDCLAAREESFLKDATKGEREIALRLESVKLTLKLNLEEIKTLFSSSLWRGFHSRLPPTLRAGGGDLIESRQCSKGAEIILVQTQKATSREKYEFTIR
jgi:hypothetical protein